MKKQISTSQRPSSNQFKFTLLAIALLFISLLIINKTQLHTDVLYLTSIMKSALLKNSDIFSLTIDINSPVAYWFGLPAIYLQDFLQITLETAIEITVLTLIIISLYLVFKILFNIVEQGQRSQNCFLIVAWMYLFAGWEFGQREHLMLLLTTPWLLHTIITSDLNLHLNVSKSTKVLVGIMAGIGFLMKPIFILIPVTMIVFCIINNRSFNFIFSKSISSYFITTLIIAITVCFYEPNYIVYLIEGFRSYSHFDTGINMLLRIEHFWLLLVLLTSSYLYIKNKLTIFHAGLITACILFWVVAMIQNKGFSHHFYPFESFVVLCLFTLTDSIPIQQLPFNNLKKYFIFIRKYAFIYFALLIFSRHILLAFYAPLSLNSPKYQELEGFVSQYTENDTMMSFSTELYPLLLLEERIGIEWVGSYRNFWSLPGYYKNINKNIDPFPYLHPGEMSVDEQKFFETVVNDVVTKNPTLIFVHDGAYKNGLGLTTFDFIDYFEQNTLFKEEFSKYESVGRQYVYEIYIRKK